MRPSSTEGGSGDAPGGGGVLRAPLRRSRAPHVRLWFGALVVALGLLAPAGLWKRETPQYCQLSLRTTRWLAKHAAAPLSWLVRFRLGRIVVLGQTHGRAWRMDPAAAQLAVRTLGASRGFDAALKATLHDRYRSRGSITAPVTLAFGSRDLVLLRRQSRHVEELPIDTRRVTLAGCGHLPVADGPAVDARASPKTDPMSSDSPSACSARWPFRWP